MANIILFDNEVRERLLPLTYTRPVCELRVGILTIMEKWKKWLGEEHTYSYITQDYLAEKYSIEYGNENLVINGSVMPSEQLMSLIKYINFNEAYIKGEDLILAKLDEKQFEKLIQDEPIDELKGIDLENTEYLKLNNLWDIYQLNDAA
ncbi:MAG: putative sugar nucleotidyl transferase, partial [Bacteroidota bacterium]